MGEICGGETRGRIDLMYIRVGKRVPAWVRERGKSMVRKGVTGGSAIQYKGHWSKWADFLGSIAEEDRPDEYLEEVVEAEDKVMFIMGFIWYLVEELGIKGAKEVSGVVSGVRFQWKKEGVDSSFFEDHRVRAAKKGARLTTEQMRAWARKSRDNRKLPAFWGMVQWLREELYKGSGWDADGMYNKGVYLAAAVAFDVGLRPGNVRKVDGPNREDHCIRAGELVFRVEEGGTEIAISGGEPIREYLGIEIGEGWTVNAERLAALKGVGVQVVTSKTSNRVRAPLTEWTIQRGNEFEEALVTDLGEFMVRSGVKGEDPFCSRWAAGRRGVLQRKVVTSADLSKAVKRAAAAFGLPPANFSAKSLRSGFASHMAACGVPQEQFKARGGWSEKSRVPNDHYIHQFARGAFSVVVNEEGEQLGLDEDDVRALLPVEPMADGNEGEANGPVSLGGLQ
jgi:hypothetical protein